MHAHTHTHTHTLNQTAVFTLSGSVGTFRWPQHRLDWIDVWSHGSFHTIHNTLNPTHNQPDGQPFFTDLGRRRQWKIHFYSWFSVFVVPVVDPQGLTLALRHQRPLLSCETALTFSPRLTAPANTHTLTHTHTHTPQVSSAWNKGSIHSQLTLSYLSLWLRKLEDSPWTNQFENDNNHPSNWLNVYIKTTATKPPVWKAIMCERCRATTKCRPSSVCTRWLERTVFILGHQHSWTCSKPGAGYGD